MRKELNKDWERRDTIVFGKPCDWEKSTGGIHHFDNLTVDDLKLLVEEGFADPEDCQNSAPNIAEMIEYAEGHEGFTFDGYVVSPKRDDYRVSIEGLTYEGETTKQDVIDFANFASYADERTMNDTVLSAWWD